MSGGDAWPAWDGVSLPTDELRDAAERELGETAERRTSALSELRAALERLPQADRPPDVRDATLLRALRLRKFDVQKALSLLTKLCAFRRKYSQYFEGFSGERLRPIAEALAASGALRVLPAPGVGGQRVVCAVAARLPLDDFPSEDLAAFTFWVADRLARDPHVQVHGISALGSYEGVTLAQVHRLFTLVPLATRLEYNNGCFAARYGLIHLVHAPAFVAGLFALVRPLLPHKVAARVHFFPDYAADGVLALLVDPAAAPPPFSRDAAAGAAAGAAAEAAMKAWVQRQIELEAQGL